MVKEVITFGDIEIEKHKFRQQKNPITIYDANIDGIIVPNKVLDCKKTF